MDHAMEFELVTDGLIFPEGPVWLPDGSVLVCEIGTGTLQRVRPDGSKTIAADVGGGPNGAALGPDGRIYVCNNGGLAMETMPDGKLVATGRAADYRSGRIEAVDLQTGAVEILYESCNGILLSAPNDLVFDGLGGFYFTDFSPAHGRPNECGGVYYAFADGSMIMPVVYPVDHPNGCGLSPDGKTLYVAQSFWRTVITFEILAPGKVRGSAPGPAEMFPGRQLAMFRHGVAPDSMAVLADGSVAVGTFGEGTISVIDSRTGDYVMHPFPDAATTNICFGGADMRDAWITQTWTGKLLKARWDRPGLELPHYATFRA